MCWRRGFLYDGLPSRLLAGSHECYVILSGDDGEGLGNLVGRAGLVYVDGIKVIGRSVEELILNLRAVLLRCMECGLFLAAHERVLFAKEVKWCGKLN